jgi:hypothetical protein
MSERPSRLGRLELNLETIQELTEGEAAGVAGGLMDTRSCQYCLPPPPSAKASVCNSCYNTDCCLMVP